MAAAWPAQAWDGIPAPANLHPGVTPDSQSLEWEWPGGPIDGFRLYQNQDGKAVRVADKANAALRMIIVEPSKGQRSGSTCYSVRAYKGLAESQSSNEVCLEAPTQAAQGQPLPPISLRLTSSASECAAAAGAVPGAICDAVLKEGAKVLVFNWAGEADIDGYRLYDSAGGKPVLQETKYDPDQRVFQLPAAIAGKVTDYCFQVRAFRGERESWPTNTVCADRPPVVAAPAPSGNVLVLAPSGGALLTSVETYKNFNPGCPYPAHTIKTRTKAAFKDGVKATYALRDLNSACGERVVMWNEGSAEFALDALPARFFKATLKFVSEGGDAQQGCVRDVFAYNLAIQDKSPGGGRYEKLGDPLAWFTYHKTASIASAASLAPQGGNAFDVTALLRKSIQRRHKNQGFNFAVKQDKQGCTAGYKAFTLEIET
ncbi:MAG: hypothetical protein V4484_00370 [Pseudomonadota bacterium]